MPRPPPHRLVLVLRELPRRKGTPIASRLVASVEEGLAVADVLVDLTGWELARLRDTGQVDTWLAGRRLAVRLGACPCRQPGRHVIGGPAVHPPRPWETLTLTIRGGHGRCSRMQSYASLLEAEAALAALGTPAEQRLWILLAGHGAINPARHGIGRQVAWVQVERGAGFQQVG